MTLLQPPGAVGHVLLTCQAVLAIIFVLAGGLAALHFAGRDRGARTRSIALGAICLALVAAIPALGIGILTRGPIVQLDAWAATVLFTHRIAWLDQVMMAISALGDGTERTVATVVLCGWLLWRRRTRWALALAAVMIAAAVLTPGLKTAFHFARPLLLYSGADAFSFPSGHATSAAALYILLAWMAARSLPRSIKAIPWVVAVVLIGLTGLSRVYVGAHWLSDVLAGFALGGALGVAGVLLAGESVAGERRDGWIILAILVVIGVILGPAAFGKARRLYAPYLSRSVEKAVDPGHLGEPGGAPIAPPPGV